MLSPVYSLSQNLSWEINHNFAGEILKDPRAYIFQLIFKVAIAR